MRRKNLDILEPAIPRQLEEELAIAVETAMFKIRAVAVILRQSPQEERRKYVDSLIETLRKRHIDDEDMLRYVNERMGPALEKLLGLEKIE